MSLWQLSELKKANERVLEAEKGRFCAEAEKRLLEERVQEIGMKLNAADEKLGVADNKLREAEMHRQLLHR